MNLQRFRKLQSGKRSLLFLLLLPLLSCSPGATSIFSHDRPAGNEFMLMSYNLRLYAYIDRDDDGQPDDFKPESEINPLISIVNQSQPDILVIQEMGGSSALDDLQERLKKAGINYPHIDYLKNRGTFANLAILSKYPISSTHPVTNLSYTVKGKQYPVLRGFQQVVIEVKPQHFLTVINVHLKSKIYHPAGQTEMRRNESRLLATHVRRLLKSDPQNQIIVCGDFNDSVHSSSMREMLEDNQSGLDDLSLRDSLGQIWTHFYRYGETYSRIDYLLTSDSLRKHWVKEKSGIILSPLTQAASDHRPIYATFNLRN